MKFDFITKQPWYGSLIRALPWVLGPIGLIVISIGFFIDIEGAKFSKFLIATGSAILSGGIFAVVLKSLQFTGIFKEELSKIVTGNEYLKNLNDEAKTLLWKKVTTSIHDDTFPELSENIHEGIINNYFPTEKKHYYEDYRRVCKIKWHDKKNKVLESEETTFYKIKPKSPDEEIRHTYTYETKLDNKLFETVINMEKLIINGKDYSDKLKNNSFKNNDTICIDYSYEIKLKGEQKYSLERKIIKQFSLASDPCSRYYSDTFILDSYIKVIIEAEGLKAIFIESGSSKLFEDFHKNEATDCAKNGRDIEKDYKNILFPRQGYVLHYHCD